MPRIIVCCAAGVRRFARPMAEAGFQIKKIVGVEGPAWFVRSLPNQWKAAEKRELLLEWLGTVAQHRYVFGAHPIWDWAEVAQWFSRRCNSY